VAVNSDTFAVRVVVVVLGVGVLLGLGTMAILAVMETPIPDQLDRLVTLMGGALIGVLAKTSTTGADDPPQPVQVMNEPDEGVPVVPGAAS
jgi:hypothetical protein